MIMLAFDSKEIESALTQLAAALPGKISEAVTAAAQAIEAEAKERCPVDSGILRRSITTDVSAVGGNVTAIVGTNIEYAPYIHQGTGIYALEGNGRKNVPWAYKDAKTGDLIWTKGSKPQPFLRDAVDDVQPGLVKYFEDMLRRG